MKLKKKIFILPLLISFILFTTLNVNASVNINDNDDNENNNNNQWSWTTTTSSNTNGNNNNDDFQPHYIVIGCGNSGNALAYSLLMRTNKKIAMVCSGQEIAMGRNQTDNEDTYVWWYKDGESPKRTKGISINNDFISVESNALMGNRGFFVPLATNVLSGLSATNGLTYGGNGRDYWNQWGSIVDSGNGDDISQLWNWEHIKEIYRPLENYLGNDPTNQHGLGGPLTFNSIPVEKFGQNLRKAFINITGAPYLSDANGDESIGFGESVRNFKEYWQPSGDSYAIRQDSYSTLIKPYLTAYGARIRVISQATVLKFVYNRTPGNNGNNNWNNNNNLKVKGVSFLKNGEIYTLSANNDVIVTAGALSSIHLLLLNGIGPRKDLMQFNIPVYVDQPLVGQDFFNQMQFLTLVYNSNANIEDRNRGSATMGLVRSSRAIAENDPLPDVMHASGRVAQTVSMIVTQQNRYKFRGQVNIQSLDYLVKPEVTFGSYNLNDGHSDMNVLVEAFKRNRQAIALTPGAIEIGDTAAKVPQGATDDMIRTYLYGVVDGNWHIHGGNKMGKSFMNGVVDSRFNVFGVRNLRVCDNSVAPIQHPGHAAASSAIYVGVICADAIIQDL